jgi:uncharacterized SAM-binding protein YcdF (DUF218 family)
VFVRTLLLELFLPPQGFLTLALLALLLSVVRPRAGRRLLLFSVLGLVAFAMPVVSKNLMVALESGLDQVQTPAEPPAAIVILGAETTSSGGLSPGVRIGRLTLERVRQGAETARATGLPVLVTGGPTQNQGPPVGGLMAQSLHDDFNVDARWVETQSRNTAENAQFSAAILAPLHIRSVFLVTHPWHMKRALGAFERAGLIAMPAPTPLDRYADQPEDLLPRVSALQTGFYAMHEWIGRAWYALH